MRRLIGHRLVATAAAGLLCAVLCGCGAGDLRRTLDRNAGRTTLSKEAEATYNYLVYQQLALELHRLTQTAEDTPENIEKALGLQERAAEALRGVIAVEPRPELYVELANLYWNPNQVVQARGFLKEGLKRFPDARQLHLALSNSYMLEDRIQDAAVTLRTYLEQHPDDTGLRHHLGQILVDDQQYAAALDAMTPIPEAERTPQTRLLMARAQIRLGQLRQARANLEALLDEDPSYLEGWAELAYLFELSKDYARAEEAYQQMLDLGDAREDVWLRLISMKLKLNDPDAALDLALAGPGSKSFLLDAAVTFLGEGFPAQASAVLDRLQARLPEAPELAFYRAVIAYDGERDPAKALDYLAQVPADSQHYDRALHFEAELLFTLGRDQEALEVLAEGRSRYPGKHEFSTLWAGYLMDEGRFQEARDVLEDALEVLPGNPEILYHLGLVQEQLYGIDEAVEVMEKVIARDPDHADALNYVGYVLADEDHDLDRAQVLIERALRLEPDSGYIIDSLAWVLYRKGKYAEAMDQIERALALVADDPTVWEHYGDIAAALGDTAKAREGWTKALDLGSSEAQRVRRKLEALP